MTTPLRPKQPIPTLPCRLITPNKDVITWFQDGYITKKDKHGNTESWVPFMFCSAAPISFDTLSPTGKSHKIYYSTILDTVELEGEIINFHMIDNGGDSDIICWEDECHCFDELNQMSLESSRCGRVGFHMGCPYCPVCGPEIEDEDDRDRYYDETEEFADYQILG